ncbi:MAG TPA: hypothetical protein VIK85_02490 [Coriobacteriia bacterium]
MKWRNAASVGVALLCIGAGVWVYFGGERAFLISYVDLGFHELGHLLLAWAPGIVAPLAGSVFQVLVPIGLALYFGTRRESYASALMLAWAATSAANVSVYVADAPSQELWLLGNGRHDWAWVFGQLGHMDWAAPFASGVRWFAIALAVLGLIVAVLPLLTPHARERAVARDRAESDAREAALRAKAPRHEPRNIPNAPRKQAPPAAPAGRF